MITEGLRGVLTLPPDERKSRQNRLVSYIIASLNMHNSYSFGYFFCEALNLINVVSFIMLFVFIITKQHKLSLLDRQCYFH